MVQFFYRILSSGSDLTKAQCYEYFKFINWIAISVSLRSSHKLQWQQKSQLRYLLRSFTGIVERKQIEWKQSNITFSILLVFVRNLFYFAIHSSDVFFPSYFCSLVFYCFSFSPHQFTVTTLGACIQYSSHCSSRKIWNFMQYKTFPLHCIYLSSSTAWNTRAS